MAQPTANTKQYFVGIAGEQVGPLDEANVLKKIRAGEIPQDALLWYEGLPDWSPIDTIAPFKTEFTQKEENPWESDEPITSSESGLFEESSASQPAAKAQPVQASPSPSTERELPDLAGNDEEEEADYKFKTDPGRPVFTKAQGTFEDPALVKKRAISIGVGVTLVIFVLVGYTMFFKVSKDDYANKTTKPIKLAKAEIRENELRKALSELVLKPNESLATLEKLVRENHKDKAGEEGLESALDYYRTHQKPEQEGRLLMLAKRPKEAAKVFLADPTFQRQAEEALFKSFEISEGAEKKQFLLDNIKLIIGPLQDTALALERIKLFEKSFPGERHPYGYYLKSSDEKIADLFSRISFFYVQALLAYIDTELPQINLMERPRVEVRKDSTSRYRLVGSYKGDVLLNQDALKNIQFTFWLVGDKWVLVDTNLTKERSLAAGEEKEARKDTSVTAELLLAQLETVFKTQFPKHALHEAIDPNREKRKVDF